MSLDELDAFLRDPHWVHLGQSLQREPGPLQLYQGLAVGEDGTRSAVFVFPNVVEALTATSVIYVDGTFKKAKTLLRGHIKQVLLVLTSFQDHVC